MKLTLICRQFVKKIPPDKISLAFSSAASSSVFNFLEHQKEQIEEDSYRYLLTYLLLCTAMCSIQCVASLYNKFRQFVSFTMKCIRFNNRFWRFNIWRIKMKNRRQTFGEPPTQRPWPRTHE